MSNHLPPSLAAKPNIALEHQTIEQLEAERAYWQHQIDSADGWGAAVGAAAGYVRGCDAWIAKRTLALPQQPSQPQQQEGGDR